ncbi:enoyl-CoA hydratase/isomerase family protein [Nocardioides sambongensis]|uniref:enoyl-CoA hydratase/isomerase family protein n=1 Tax=Nocardioides sambongensis TaxID=2589074 RepID=UPI00112E01D7|nr:enoyl-CoA hydratase/isomerase family protein [Nocardioides sambongensis]
MAQPTIADRLLDAQIAWLLSRLDGPEVSARLAEEVDDLLAVAARISLAHAVPPAALKELVALLLERVPSGAAASTATGVAADAAYDGPGVDATVADLISRDHVEALLSAAAERADLVEAALERIARSPLAATVAARFVARIVGDVLATNRAVAERIPGVGGLVSLGSSMAGRVAGIADKQVEALLGDTAERGAAFAMRRLNRLVVETLRDPTTVAAALEVFDLYATAPLSSLSGARHGDRTEVHRLAGLVQDVVIDAAPSAPVRDLVDRLVDGFYAVYGEESLAVLVEDLGLDRDAIVEVARATVPDLLERAVASGEVERILRARLQPFFASPEVAAILDER